MEYSARDSAGRKTCAQREPEVLRQARFGSAQKGSVSRWFWLSGNCAFEQFPTFFDKVAMYRCETTSVAGFIQQLAVAYVARGYWFYVVGSIPAGKEPRRTDARLISKYGVDVSKWTRVRRKRQGRASVQYLRFQRFFVLLATEGEHPFYFEEPFIFDIRERPIRFAGYSVSCRKGRDGKWHPLVRIDGLEFGLIKQQLLKAALTASAEVMAARIRRLGFMPYRPVRSQYRQLLYAINHRRQLASLEILPKEVLPTRRRIVEPFS